MVLNAIRFLLRSLTSKHGNHFVQFSVKIRFSYFSAFRHQISERKKFLARFKRGSKSSLCRSGKCDVFITRAAFRNRS